MDPNMNKTKRAIWMSILNTGGGVYWPMDWRSIHKWCIKIKGRLLCLIQGPCIQRENDLVIYDTYMNPEREWSSDLWYIYELRESGMSIYNVYTTTTRNDLLVYDIYMNT